VRFKVSSTIQGNIAKQKIKMKKQNKLDKLILEKANRYRGILVKDTIVIALKIV